jgi:hypothetical protein
VLAACGRLRTLTAVLRREGDVSGNPARCTELLMNDKSHVSLEQRVCLVCGTRFDTGAILLDRQLRASMERHTATGWGLCPEHQTLSDDGFVALVECDPQRSGAVSAAGRMQPGQVYRTGRTAHLKRDAFARVFDAPIAEDQPCVFVEPGVIERLQAMTGTTAP